MVLAELQGEASPALTALFLKVFLLEIKVQDEGGEIGLWPMWKPCALCGHSDWWDEKGKEKSNEDVKIFAETEVSISSLLIR